MAGPLVLGVVLLAATLLLLGIQPWLDFVAVLHNARPASPYYVQSVTRVFGPMVGYTLAALLLGLVLLVRDDAVAFALLSIAMIAPAPDLVPTTCLSRWSACCRSSRGPSHGPQDAHP